jgi:hypothetical protein
VVKAQVHFSPEKVKGKDFAGDVTHDISWLYIIFIDYF